MQSLKNEQTLEQFFEPLYTLNLSFAKHAMTWLKVTHWGAGLFCHLFFLCRINLTLFSFLQRKDKGNPLSAAEAAWDTESQNAESSSHVVVYPISMRPISALKYANRNWGDELVDGKRVGGQDDNKKDDTRVNEGGEMSVRQKGCQDSWHVLDQLHSVIGKIPCNVPKAKSSEVAPRNWHCYSHTNQQHQ